MAGVAQTAHPNVLVVTVKRSCCYGPVDQRKLQTQVALVAVVGGRVDDRDGSVSEFVVQSYLLDRSCVVAVPIVPIRVSRESMRGFMKLPLQVYWIFANAYLRG